MRALTFGLIFVSAATAACSGDELDSGPGGTGGQVTILDPLPKPASTHSHGEPTALEQALLEEIQRARANPPAEGERIVALPEVQGAMAQFNVDPLEVVADFAGYAPVPPLAFDAALMASSKFHSEDMAQNGFQEHDGSAGESFDQRITDAGYDWSFIAENIFAYAESVPYCHAAFLIDWGNPGLGHREAILDLDGEKRDIGISIIENPPSPAVGPLVVTQDFGMPLTDKSRYLLGVAYVDSDGDGAYDAGEGRAGLSIVVEGGDAYAVTGASGGYAVPMGQGAGAVKVQVQSAAGKALIEHDATMADDNVKVDFVLTPALLGE